MSLITKKLNAAPATPAAVVKPTLGGIAGKKLGGLKKLNAQPKEIDLDNSVEEAIEEAPKTAIKPKLGGGLKKINTIKKEETEVKEPKEEVKEEVKEEIAPAEELPTFEPAEETKVKPKIGANKLIAKKIEESSTVAKETKEEVEETVVEEQKEEEIAEEKPVKKKTAAKKKTTKKKTTEDEIVASLEVDESKRVSIEEMDAIMRPIVAPTTEHWEQEKKDVLEALDNIKVEQDMEMSQVKEALADLDELNFMILPKLHDAETMYDGTKQNYDTVKAIAISKGNATNAEGRKAEGIIACQNFVTPSGAVVDLHQYMLLIEERYKFYQKISDGISFKKYSLINYNNALKIENRN